MAILALDVGFAGVDQTLEFFDHIEVHDWDPPMVGTDLFGIFLNGMDFCTNGFGSWANIFGFVLTGCFCHVANACGD